MLEILGGFLPFLVLVVCHVLTQAAACRPCRRHQPGAPACCGFARVAKTILSAYVVLRLPYQLAQLLYLAFLWDFYPGYLLWEALVYSDYLILLNSCLSPFLCLLASTDLRALLRAMLTSFAAALCEERPGSFMPADPQTQVDSGDQTVCLCQEGWGGGTWEVARSREAASYFDSTEGRAAVFALRQRAKGKA